MLVSITPHTLTKLIVVAGWGKGDGIFTRKDAREVGKGPALHVKKTNPRRRPTCQERAEAHTRVSMCMFLKMDPHKGHLAQSILEHGDLDVNSF